MSPLSVRNGGGTVCRVRFAQRAPSPRGCTGGTSWSVCQSGTARSSCCRTCSPPVCCSRCRCWFRSALGHGVEVFWSPAPLAIRAMTGTSTPLSAPSATSTPASSPPLGLSLAGRLPLSLGVDGARQIFRGTGFL